LHRPPAVSGPLIFGWTLLIVAALVRAPAEFGHYRRWLELVPEETVLRVAVAATLLGSALFVVAIGGTLLTLFARRVQPRTLRRVAIVFAAVGVAIGAGDLELQRATGNPLAVYLPFLFEAETFVWAGEGFAPWHAGLRVIAAVAIAVGSGALVATGVERWAGRGDPRRSAIALGLLVGLVVVVPLGAPLLQRAATAPMAFAELGDRLVWSGPGGWLAPGDAAFPMQAPHHAKMRARWARALRALDETAVAWSSEDRSASTEPTAPDLPDLPDVLIVVVESLRADALDPVTMPRLDAWSKRGLRLDRHYATSNASHYGLFALLYGESPLRYFDALEAGASPVLPRALHDLGYSTHLVTCAELDWRDMDRFLGPPHFALERLSGDGLADCDRRVSERAAALLVPGPRAPRFVLAFLMSTHFGYHHPEDAAPFQPSMPPPNALELDADRDRAALRNRYRNSARHVDAVTADVVDSLDPKQTLIVFTGDHGEALFDDGTLAHASRLSESQTRVPFVLVGPGVAAGQVRSGPTDHVDVPRTILARLGHDVVTQARVPGVDLVSDPPREFVTLVHAKSRRADADRIALVSEADRIGVRLDRERGVVRFAVTLGADGRPLRSRVSAEGAARATAWLDRYLAELTAGEAGFSSTRSTRPSSVIE